MNFDQVTVLALVKTIYILIHSKLLCSITLFFMIKHVLSVMEKYVNRLALTTFLQFVIYKAKLFFILV
jgi:hypothetical protein